jgi:DHA2 family multidrug resistance protein-like MFS transporter
MTTQASRAVPAQDFKGNDRALLGIVLGVVTFWLFAGTIGTIARSVLTDINGGPIDTVANPAVTLDQMNLAVSVTALFSGLFIVLFGGVADRVGRVRIAIAGNVLGIVVLRRAASGVSYASVVPPLDELLNPVLYQDVRAGPLARSQPCT